MNPDQEIILLFNQASYHFADDSIKEWDKAYWRLDKAANLIVKYQYPLYRIKEMVKASNGLIDIDTVLTRILNLVYNQTAC